MRNGGPPLLMPVVDDSSSNEEPPALADASGVVSLHCHTGACMYAILFCAPLATILIVLPWMLRR